MNARRRALVVNPCKATRERMRHALEVQGLEVVTCPGPSGTVPCPLLEGERCPKLERVGWNAVAYVSFDPDDPKLSSLLAAYKRHFAQVVATDVRPADEQAVRRLGVGTLSDVQHSIDG